MTNTNDWARFHDDDNNNGNILLHFILFKMFGSDHMHWIRKSQCQPLEVVSAAFYVIVVFPLQLPESSLSFSSI